jgi:RNA polymerase sigma-70 factor (ECF subfamily)
MNESEVRDQLEKCHPSCYGWALSCSSRDPLEAEDVLQTAYLKVLQGVARYDGRSAFKTWLFAVIRRTAADERRRHWLRRLRLAGYKRERELSFQPAERGARLEESEMLTVFQKALARLPRRQREVLHLVFYQDLSLQEAAGVMGVTVGSARAHYERGKAHLREWLKQSEQFNEYRSDRQQAQTSFQ